MPRRFLEIPARAGAAPPVGGDRDSPPSLLKSGQGTAGPRPVLRLGLGLLLLLAGRFLQADNRCDEMIAAAQINDVKRVAALVNQGAGVDCRDAATAQTALMAVATSGHVDVVRLLLSLGADPNLKSAQGKTALGMVRSRVVAFAKLPGYADLVQRQRQVIAILEPRTAAGPASEADATQAEARPADPDQIARFKLQTARDAVAAGQYTAAMRALTEVFALKGVSELNRTRSMAITADLSLRRQDWKLAKVASERVVNSTGADEEAKAFCKGVLKTLRNDHPELFQ